MTIKCLPVGQIEANCYIVADEDTLLCAVIDPGDESNTILNYIEEHGLKVECIFLTHGHFDHVMAVNAVQEETGAPVYMHRADANEPGATVSYKFTPPENTRWYQEGDTIQVGSLTFRVMETPGHSPGSVSLLCGDALFSGDALFRESCGRTDLEGGDMGVLMQSLKRLGELPGDYEVYPGHMDSTTMSRERLFNYYLRYAMENL